MSAAACVLCNHSTNDALQLGEKITYEDTTAHLYCLVSIKYRIVLLEFRHNIYNHSFVKYSSRRPSLVDEMLDSIGSMKGTNE